MTIFNKALAPVHPSWRPFIETALQEMDPSYLKHLEDSTDWLPNISQIFNAFSQPIENMRYILLGESPYPRATSANGYAFWDGNVDELWSNSGLAKPVNRATSLRNLLKMLLITHGLLSEKDTSQAAIAAVPKQALVKTLADLFENLLNHGFVLLNASLVLSDKPVALDAKQWLPFMESLLKSIQQSYPETTLVLFGKIALVINKLPIAEHFSQVIAEHPYNISFIHNKAIQAFFEPFHLLTVSN